MTLEWLITDCLSVSREAPYLYLIFRAAGLR